MYKKDKGRYIRMKRKVIALLLASTMVLSMTACGGSTPNA